MTGKQVCFGHENGFEHFAVDLAGMDKQFDLGIKYEETEPDDWSIDSVTGVKAWAEPVLVLYVSVHRDGIPNTCSVTLRYGLTRSKFTAGLIPNDEDKRKLLELAKPHLGTDLNLLRAGEIVNASRKIKML